jgi:tetratricopeptide (TPR) repeat protein
VDLKSLPSSTIRYLSTQYIEKLGYKINSSRFADYEAELSATSISNSKKLLVKIDTSGNKITKNALKFTITRCEQDECDCIYIATGGFESTNIKSVQRIELIDCNRLAEKLTEYGIQIKRSKTDVKDMNAYLPSVAELESFMKTGNRFYRKKEYQTALYFYERAVQLKRNYDFAWCMKALSHTQLRMYEDAINAYKKALLANRKNITAWYNLAIVLGILRRFEEELDCYEQVLKIQPNFEKALLNKGVALYNLNRFEEALECFDKYVSIFNTREGWNNKAITLQKLNRVDDALDCIEKALKIDENYIDALLNKAIILEAKGRTKDALNCYTKIIAEKPNNLTALYRKGCCLLKNEQYEDALKTFTHLLKISPDFMDASEKKKIAAERIKEKA